MPVAVGPYGPSQPSCFNRVKMGFVVGCAKGKTAGDRNAGPELMGGVGKTMMQSGHRDGQPMLISAVVAHNMHPSHQFHPMCTIIKQVFE
ncbi:hypothetical protein FD754_011598 [Muntiacus muntjak]|uniref:Reactive oxygen species modulator 1 n=1 Tax=Muntiacus muntjak TaxID=9888 RepID=A0A5N3VC14_MUNMU|nr:hypothetical protein FD754_011598 [Muntiacus muntjak]